VTSLSGTNAVVSLCPEHVYFSLCPFEHAREHVRSAQPGQVYFGLTDWQITQRVGSVVCAAGGAVELDARRDAGISGSGGAGRNDGRTGKGWFMLRVWVV
jgi:hypothetical protein